MNLRAALAVMSGGEMLPPPPAVPVFKTLEELSEWNRGKNAEYLIEELRRRDSSMRLALDLLEKGHHIAATVTLRRALGKR